MPNWQVDFEVDETILGPMTTKEACDKLEALCRANPMVHDSEPQFVGDYEEVEAAALGKEPVVAMSFHNELSAEEAAFTAQQNGFRVSEPRRGPGEMQFHAHNYMSFSQVTVNAVGEESPDGEDLGMIEWFTSPTDFIKSLREAADKLEEFVKANPHDDIEVDID